MLKSLSIVAIALTLLPVAAGAQRMPLDPYGRPYVMSPPQPTPGDPGYGRAMPMQSQGVPMAGPAYPQQAQAVTSDTGACATFRDEYGFRYNCRGDLIDRAGRIRPGPFTPPGARALR